MAARKPRISHPVTATGAKTTNYIFKAPRAKGAVMVLVATVPLKKGAKKALRKKLLAEAGDSIIKKYNATFSKDESFKMAIISGERPLSTRRLREWAR